MQKSEGASQGQVIPNTDKERTALAMLSSGASFQDASELTRIPVDRLMELWRKTRK